MCPSNTAKSICGHPISEYLEKEHKVKKVPVFFCAETRGAVINALLEHADSTPRSTFVPELFQDDSVLERCHLNFPPRGGYGRLILKTFKTTVKWIERRCVDFDLLLPMPDGLVRRPGLEFESDKAAGEWFNDFFDKAKLRASQREMLSGFANLSLDDCAEISKALSKTKDKAKAPMSTKRLPSRTEGDTTRTKDKTKATKTLKRIPSPTKEPSVGSKVQTGRVGKKARKENRKDIKA
ncbi:hypothetical protein Neosp_015262 [[Neocosmospora] mangrovei]